MTIFHLLEAGFKDGNCCILLFGSSNTLINSWSTTCQIFLEFGMISRGCFFGPTQFCDGELLYKEVRAKDCSCNAGIDLSITLYLRLFFRSFWRGNPDPSPDQTEHGWIAGQPAERSCPHLRWAAGARLSRGHWKVRQAYYNEIFVKNVSLKHRKWDEYLLLIFLFKANSL